MKRIAADQESSGIIMNKRSRIESPYGLFLLHSYRLTPLASKVNEELEKSSKNVLNWWSAISITYICKAYISSLVFIFLNYHSNFMPYFSKLVIFSILWSVKSLGGSIRRVKHFFIYKSLKTLWHFH